MRVSKEWLETYCSESCIKNELDKYPEPKKGYLIELSKLGKELAEKGELYNSFDLITGDVPLTFHADKKNNRGEEEMTLTTTIKDGNKYEETLIKYHEEREKNVELLSELARTLEDMRFLSSENRYLREKHKNDMDRYKNLDKGLEVDHLGQLWVLVEEFYYDHNELKNYPDDAMYVHTLRGLYDERECGKFYQLMTRGDIRKLIRKENADEYTPYV